MASRLPRRSRSVVSAGLQEIAAVEADRAAKLRRLLRQQQAHDRERRHALAAARFADQPERRAARDARGRRRRPHAWCGRRRRGKHAQALDLEQRAAVIDFAPRVAAAMPASISARSVMPAGFCRVGRNFRKCTQRSRLTRFQPRQFGERIGVVVDAQIELGPFFLAVDQQRRRLLAALVAAGRLAGVQRRDQAARRTAGARSRHRPARSRRAPRRRPACCRRPRSRRRRRCPHQSTHSSPVCAAIRPSRSMT